MITLSLEELLVIELNNVIKWAKANDYLHAANYIEAKVEELCKRIDSKWREANDSSI